MAQPVEALPSTQVVVSGPWDRALRRVSFSAGKEVGK